LLEWHYGKSEILEAYVNEVFLGQSGNRAIHGFALASEHYFGRPLDELPAPALALLAGMVKAPSAYDPRRHPQRARAAIHNVPASGATWCWPSSSGPGRSILPG